LAAVIYFLVKSRFPLEKTPDLRVRRQTRGACTVMQPAYKSRAQLILGQHLISRYASFAKVLGTRLPGGRQGGPGKIFCGWCLSGLA
jgi:hypothetical protein